MDYRGTGSDWSQKEEPATSIAAILDAQRLASEKRPQTQILAARSMPGTPTDEVFSVQPKQSVSYRSYRSTLNTPTSPPMPSSPSGHNPAHKIKQLMGIDVSPDDSHLCDITEISSLSPASYTSSIYSEDLEAAFSDDTDVYIKLHDDTSSGSRSNQIGSNTTSWDGWEHQSAVDVPLALNISGVPLKELPLGMKAPAPSPLPAHRRNSSPGVGKDNVVIDKSHFSHASDPNPDSTSDLSQRMVRFSIENRARHQRMAPLTAPKARLLPAPLNLANSKQPDSPTVSRRNTLPYQPAPRTPYPPVCSAFDDDSDDECEEEESSKGTASIAVSRVTRHGSLIAKAFKKSDSVARFRRSRPATPQTCSDVAERSSGSRPETREGELVGDNSCSTSTSSITPVTITRNSFSSLSFRGGRRMSSAFAARTKEFTARTGQFATRTGEMAAARTTEFATRTGQFARLAATEGLKTRAEKKRELFKAKIRVVEVLSEEDPAPIDTQLQKAPPRPPRNPLRPPPPPPGRPGARPPARKDGLSWV